MKIKGQYTDLVYEPDWVFVFPDGTRYDNLEQPEEERVRVHYKMLTTQQKNRIFAKHQDRRGGVDGMKVSRDQFIESVIRIENLHVEEDEIITGKDLWEHERRPEDLVSLIQFAFMGQKDEAVGKHYSRVGNSGEPSPSS